MLAGMGRKEAERALDRLGWFVAAAGVVGLIVRTDLYIVWAFMIAFGLAKVPETAFRRLRARRRKTLS